jgi:putative DNA primase/helicase
MESLYQHVCDVISPEPTPATVALVTDAVTGRPMTLHRTWVQADGTKAPVAKNRLLWPGLPKVGGVVRLWPDDELTTGLAVAEGIETSLALARGYGLAWSCVDKQNLAALPALAGIECITIGEDQDDAGRKAAAECARRWSAAGAEVRIARPSRPGWDLADEAAA